MKRVVLFLLLLSVASAAEVEFLESSINPDGSMGTYSFLWQTSFGALGLAQAGHNVDAQIGFILTKQGGDGGFASPCQTGPAVLLLHATGRDTASAEAYLWNAQQANGGFKDTETDVDTTAWATLAMLKLGKAPGTESFLKSAQNGDGGFAWIPGHPSYAEWTAEALIALAALGVNDESTQAGIAYLRSAGDQSAWVTALSIIAFDALGENSTGMAAYLQALRKADGGFNRHQDRDVGNPTDTGMAYLALHGYSVLLDAEPPQDNNDQDNGQDNGQDNDNGQGNDQDNDNNDGTQYWAGADESDNNGDENNNENDNNSDENNNENDNNGDENNNENDSTDDDEDNTGEEDEDNINNENENNNKEEEQDKIVYNYLAMSPLQYAGVHLTNEEKKSATGRRIASDGEDKWVEIETRAQEQQTVRTAHSASLVVLKKNSIDAKPILLSCIAICIVGIMMIRWRNKT